MSNTPSLAAAFLESTINRFSATKQMAERAIAQLTFDQLRQPLDPNTNSIAVIMKHLAGNMLSRWTDVLASDGEKSWRNRDSEFIDDFASLDALTEHWQRGWDCLFAAIASLKEEDLLRTIRVRGEPQTVLDAIHSQMAHYGYHVGQILVIARIHAGDHWTVLTIPRGQSEEYNRTHWHP